MKIITEQQLRNVIHQELRNYLFEQEQQKRFGGSTSKVLGAAIIALTMLKGHDLTAQAGGDKSGGKTQEEMIKDAGVTDKVLSQLEVNLSQKEIELMSKLYSRQKDIELQIKNAKEENASTEDIEELELKKSKIFDNIPKETTERIIKTGEAIFKYIKQASPEELESFGDLDEPEDIQKLQRKAFERRISQEGQTEDLTDALSQDLRQLVNLARQDPATASATTGAEAVEIFAASNNLLPTDKETFNYLDIIKAANDRNYGHFLLVDPTEFTDQQRQQLVNKLDSKSVKDVQSKLQENKVNNIRRRLNELRGVYV
jgi:hypothetical protein